MKAASFVYHAPTTVAEAAGLLAEHGDGAKPLAGGQSLVPLLAMRLARFEHLVDIGRINELGAIRVDDNGISIGATVRQALAEHSADVARIAPLVSRALPLIGHFQIRNSGTVGGSIAHADPASELPAVALALDAQLVIASAAGSRTVAARDFFQGTWTTALEEGDLLQEVRFPTWTGRTGFAVKELARRHGDFAIAGAAAAIALGTSGSVERAAIALFGMGSTPIRAGKTEGALLGTAPSPADLDELGRLAVSDTDPPADLHASSRYRRDVGAVLVARALASALEEARKHA